MRYRRGGLKAHTYCAPKTVLGLSLETLILIKTCDYKVLNSLILALPPRIYVVSQIYDALNAETLNSAPPRSGLLYPSIFPFVHPCTTSITLTAHDRELKAITLLHPTVTPPLTPHTAQ